MFVKKISNVGKEKVAAGTRTYRQVLISPDEAPHFSMRRFVIDPGGEIPNHTNTVEHEQYILKGKAKVGIGDETYTVKTGDVVFIPANVPHWYKAIGEEPFVFLCMIPNKEDVMNLIG
jgi:quercetin dioxygenase-like cupin family protein